VLVVQQNWFRGLVMNEFRVVVIVSQVPENVCKQSRKTVRDAQMQISILSIIIGVACMFVLIV